MFRRFRRLRLFRFGSFRVDLRHQNLSSVVVKTRRLLGNDPALFGRAVILDHVPETTRFVKRIVVDKKHVARIQAALDVPLVCAKVERRFGLIDRRIRRKLNFRLSGRFRLARLFRFDRLLRFDRLYRLLRFNRLHRLFRFNRLYRLLRFDRLHRLFRFDRLYRLFRFDRLYRLFRFDRFHRLFRFDRLYRLFRFDRFHRLLRFDRLYRRRRFKAKLAEDHIGFLFGRRSGIIRAHERQYGIRVNRVDDRYRIIQRAVQTRSGKGHLAVYLARVRHQPELCARKRGALFVAELRIVEPVDRAAQRRGHRRDEQAELASVLQRHDDLNRQPRAFGRGQLLRLRHRRGQQHGAERESRHPADESLHHVLYPPFQVNQGLARPLRHARP